MKPRFQFQALVLLIGSFYCASLPVSAQNSSGPVAIYSCASGGGSPTATGEIPLIVCPNDQFPNYSSPYKFVLGTNCDSSAGALLGNLSETLSVSGHYKLLKETGSSAIKVCTSILTLNNPSTSTLIASTTLATHDPQNCGFQLEQGAFIRSTVSTSDGSITCSFTFDITLLAQAPTAVPTATASRTPTVQPVGPTATKTITPTRTGTKTVTPYYSSSSSSAMPMPSRTATRTKTPTAYVPASGGGGGGGNYDASIGREGELTQ